MFRPLLPADNWLFRLRLTADKWLLRLRLTAYKWLFRPRLTADNWLFRPRLTADDWTLQINKTEVSDTGQYFCSLNTEPKLRNIFIHSFIHLFIYSFIHLFIYSSFHIHLYSSKCIKLILVDIYIPMISNFSILIFYIFCYINSLIQIPTWSL